MTDSKKTNLLNFTEARLRVFLNELGEPSFRANQVFKWIHQQGVALFDDMTNVSKPLRKRLAEIAEVRPPEVLLEQPSTDGTRKWVLQLDDGQCIESVFIPEKGRGTLCISSQVGCSLACSFCSTAQQGFNRNLSVAEIIGQIWLAEKLLSSDANERVVSNVVFMGMGEPLLNFTNVMDAIRILLDDNGYGLSKRRVTLSTSGIVPAIDRLFEEVDVSLAISLHAPNDELRNELVPINQKYNINELMAACRRFLANKAQRDRVTIEYVMLDGINDTPKHAFELIRLLQRLPSKINLIPFNPFPETRFKRSSQEKIDQFRDILYQHGMNTITRKTRGDDIDAACGQLVGQVKDKSKRKYQIQQINAV